MRLLFRSSFDRWTGYGNDAVDIACAMSALGVDVVPWADGLQAGLPSMFTRLLEKSPFQEFDAVLQFAPPFDVRPWDLTRYAEKRFAWTMWERTPMLASDFEGKGDRWSENRWEGLTKVFVTNPMNVEALGAVDAVTPMAVVPCGVASWPLLQRGDGPLRFLMVGMLGGRKDPFLLLNAWRELKQSVPGFDATLTLKTAAPGLHPALTELYPDVTLINAVWEPERMVRLYQEHDVMVSVSRGEGNNKPAMEFMASGGAVIASDWSGHQNWLHEDWAYPLRGSVVGSPGGWSDFRVEKEHLKERLLECWMNRAAVRKKGLLARGVMESRFSWERVVEDLLVRMSLS
jgi:glycosyltransferase involved in cell wall biosynthesis